MYCLKTFYQNRTLFAHIFIFVVMFQKKLLDKLSTDKLITYKEWQGKPVTKKKLNQQNDQQKF